MRSKEYNKAFMILIMSYLVYTTFILISFNKKLDILITFLIILVPIIFKNSIINIYESKAERKMISQEKIEKEKKKLMRHGDFLYPGIIIAIIFGLTMAEGEYLIGILLAVFSLFVLSYSTWDDAKDGMSVIYKRYILRHPHTKKSNRLNIKGPLHLNKKVKYGKE